MRAARCRAISAIGGRPWSSRSAPTAAARTSTRSRRSISAAPAERDTAAFCRQGYGALLAKLAEGIPVQLDTRGEARRHHRPRHQGRAVDDQGHDRRRATASSPPPPTCVLRAHQVRRRPAQAPARRAGEAHARQLRPHRAGAARQSARTAARRSGVREVGRPAHRRAARQCRRHAAVGDFESAASSAASLPRRATRRWSSSRSNGSPACSAPT